MMLRECFVRWLQGSLIKGRGLLRDTSLWRCVNHPNLLIKVKICKHLLSPIVRHLNPFSFLSDDLFIRLKWNPFLKPTYMRRWPKREVWGEMSKAAFDNQRFYTWLNNAWWQDDSMMDRHIDSDLKVTLEMTRWLEMLGIYSYCSKLVHHDICQFGIIAGINGLAVYVHLCIQAELSLYEPWFSFHSFFLLFF